MILLNRLFSFNIQVFADSAMTVLALFILVVPIVLIVFLIKTIRHSKDKKE